jgi:tryptophanyl-tRNA synthetase
MVSQLRHACESFDEDDKLEGELLLLEDTNDADGLEHQSKLATLRNANSEDEVDDSMLQLGLLAYPVLQAADVLLYKYVSSLSSRSDAPSDT